MQSTGASMRVLAAALAASGVAVTAAAAADQPISTAGADTLGQVIVTGQPYRPASILARTDTGSRLGISTFQTPASIYVLSGDEIRLRGDTNIQDAVTRSVGITSQAQVGNGNTGLAARGFASVNSVQVLYDGQEIAIGGGTVSFPYDPWTVDRIEVLSGPSSVLYGEGAIGGVVNVISRKPSRNQSTMARVSGGTFNTYKAAVDTTGPAGDRLSYRAALSYISSDGWVDRGHSSSITWAGQLRYDFSDRFHVTLMSDYGHQKPMNYYGIPLVNGVVREELRHVNYNLLDARTYFKDQWTRLVAEWTPNDNVTITNTAYYMTVKREWFRTDQYRFNAAANNIIRSSYSDVAHDQKQWGAVGNAAFKSQLGEMKNNFSVGYDFSSIDFTHINNGPSAGTTTTDLFNTNPGLYANGALSPFYPRYHSDSTQIALFAEDRLELSPQFSVVTGLRWDNAKADRYDFDTKLTTKGRYHPVSYRGGVIWSPVASTNIYASYSRASDFIGNLISLAAAQQPLSLPSGRQIEVGVKQALMNGRLEWTLAGYSIVKKNLLIADRANPLQSVQVGQQSSKGIEATLSFRIAHGFGANLNGTILKGRYDNFFVRSGSTVIDYAGHTPSSVPTSSFNAWLYWDVSPNLRLHSGIKNVSDTFVNDSNTEKEKGYTLVDFGARYRVTDQIVLDVLVRNALDKFYTSGFRANSTTGGGQQIVGPSRQFEVALTGRF